MVMSASLRKHHCLTQEEIREYVQRHAALAEAEGSAGGESAESGDESSQTGAAPATTTTPMTTTVSANRTLVDPLAVEDVTAGVVRVTEPAKALEALEVREEGTPTDVVGAQEIVGIEEVENPVGAVVVEETVEEASGISTRTDVVESLEVEGIEGVENSTETVVTGISIRMVADRSDLLTFALIMLAAAGVGCLLCVVAASYCLARAERVLRGGLGAGRGGSVRQ